MQVRSDPDRQEHDDPQHRADPDHTRRKPRPRPELVALLKAQAVGEADESELADCLRRSVAEVVAHQADVGIDIVSDGEFGKGISWSRYILERLDGFEDRRTRQA